MIGLTTRKFKAILCKENRRFQGSTHLGFRFRRASEAYQEDSILSDASKLCNSHSFKSG